MKRRNWFLLVVTLWLCLGSVSVYASYPPTLSVSIVPRENWTYEALATLAARGDVPGKSARHFYGDWLYNRMEMAGFVAGAVSSLAQQPEEHGTRRALLARLVTEFRPELGALGVTESQIEQALRGGDERSLAALSAGARYWLADGEGDDTYDFLAERVTFIGSSSTDSPLFVAGVSNQRKEFRAEPQDFPYLQNAFAKARWYEWEFELGREYLWWGPGYSGSMILSDNSPAFDFFKFGKDFSLGKAIGRLKIDQFVSTFDDTGTRFWLVGRRLEKTLSNQWNVAYNETAKMRKTPNPLILVLPLFLYEQLYLEEIDAEYNVLVSFDINYRFKDDASAYLDFLIDDMATPRFLRKTPGKRPRRIGWLAGVHYPFSSKTSLRAEYILTDSGTYISARPEFPQLSYTHDGYFIGHPVGPNSEAFFVRVEQKLSTNLDAVVEYLWRDARNPTQFNPENQTSYDAFLSYGFKPDSALWLRAQRFLVNQEDRVMVGVSHTF